MYTTNKIGCHIVQCCASCAYCALNITKQRICARRNKTAEPDNICADWLMKPILDKAGVPNEDGRVKKYEYLKYVLDTRIRERQLVDRGLMRSSATMSIEKLRDTWEFENRQSIYMNI